MKEKFENKIIEVCSECKRACCWYGEFMCDNSQFASTEYLTVKELRVLKAGEHEDNWYDDTMMSVYGDTAPYGYRNPVVDYEQLDHMIRNQSVINTSVCVVCDSFIDWGNKTNCEECGQNIIPF